MGNQSSHQRPRRQRVSPYVPFHIRTTLSRRLVGTHRFSPVLDLALSPCECKYSSSADAGARSAAGRTLGAPWAQGTSRIDCHTVGFRGFSGRNSTEAGAPLGGAATAPRQFGPARNGGRDCPAAAQRVPLRRGTPSPTAPKSAEAHPPRNAEKRRAVAFSALSPRTVMPVDQTVARTPPCSGSENCAVSSESQRRVTDSA